MTLSGRSHVAVNFGFQAEADIYLSAPTFRIFQNWKITIAAKTIPKVLILRHAGEAQPLEGVVDVRAEMIPPAAQLLDRNVPRNVQSLELG